MSADYTYRRQVGIAELLPAIAIGVGAGLAGYYLARLFAQRTLLVPASHGTKGIARSEPPVPPMPPRPALSKTSRP